MNVFERTHPGLLLFTLSSNAILRARVRVVEPMRLEVGQRPHFCKRLAGQRADVVMLGPLTDLAIALRLYPDLCDALGCVYIMGGATDALGERTRDCCCCRFVGDYFSRSTSFSGSPPSQAM